MTKLCALITFAALLTSCTTAQTSSALIPGGSAIQVVSVKNLSGITLQVPELYVGDAVGSAASLKQDILDLTLLAQAALISGLRKRQFKAGTDTAGYKVHAAVTEFDSNSLRSEGWLRLGITVLMINQQGHEIARGSAAEDFQLFSEGPDKLGALGQQRFIAKRLKAFVESLTNTALLKML